MWVFYSVRTKQIGVAIDTKGNIALQSSLYYGLSLPTDMSGSLYLFRSISNAPDVHKLTDEAAQIGLNSVVPVYHIPLLLGKGFDVIDHKNGYFGKTTTIGVTTSNGISGSFNANRTYEYGSVNVFDAFDLFYDKVMGW